MTFAVAPECSALGLRAGAIVFRDLTIRPSSAELRAAIVRETQAVRAKFTDAAAIRSVPEVVRFQDILRHVGANPRRDQPSVERLLTLAWKRGDLPAINSLVDAYNLVSIRTLCSLGAHDLDRFAPPATLRILTGRESFTPLGGDKPETVTPGEFGYVDAQDRLLCRLDVRQAEFSKVTTATVRSLLIVEGTDAHSPALLRQAVTEVMELVQRYCGGSTEVVTLPGEA